MVKNWYSFLKGNVLHTVSVKMFMPFELLKPLLRIHSKEITFERKKTWGACLAQQEDHVTLDLGVETASSTLNVEIT